MPVTRALALTLTLTAAATFGQPRTSPRRVPETAGRTERAVPFAVGETLTYDVAWANLLTAGTATATVRGKRPSEGSVAYELAAEGRPTPLVASLYKLSYSADTLLDAYTLLPQRGAVHSEEGRRVRVKTTVFDRPARTATYEVRTATVTTTRLSVEAATLDALSAFYLLRCIPPRKGARLALSVTDSGVMYTVSATVDALDAVATGMGQRRAWRVTPTILDASGAPAVSRRVTLWITDDAQRLPARLETELAVGRFDLTLRDASVSPAPGK
jgi:hypothetical protein